LNGNAFFLRIIAYIEDMSDAKAKIQLVDDVTKAVRKHEREINNVLDKADATLEHSATALKEAQKQLCELQKIVARTI